MWSNLKLNEYETGVLDSTSFKEDHHASTTSYSFDSSTFSIQCFVNNTLFNRLGETILPFSPDDYLEESFKE